MVRGQSPRCCGMTYHRNSNYQFHVLKVLMQILLFVKYKSGIMIVTCGGIFTFDGLQLCDVTGCLVAFDECF